MLKVEWQDVKADGVGGAGGNKEQSGWLAPASSPGEPGETTVLSPAGASGVG